MTRKSIPVRSQTRLRLLAYSNRKLLEKQSYDEAVNELLDWLEFPTTEEVQRDYSTVWDVVPRFDDDDVEQDDFEPSVRTKPALVRDD